MASASPPVAPMVAAATGAGVSTKNNSRYGGVVVRVKRKRDHLEAAPARILLPQKRVRAEEGLSSALEGLKVGQSKDAQELPKSVEVSSQISAHAAGATGVVQIAENQPGPTSTGTPGAAVNVVRNNATHGSVLDSANVLENQSQKSLDELSTTGVGPPSRGTKRAFVCELVSDGTTTSNRADHKRFKYVDLELNEKGLRPREVRQRKNDDELDFYLWHAMSCGDLGLVNSVIDDASRDINFQRAADGINALMVACLYADAENVARYLALGADPTLLDNNGHDAAFFLNESAEANRQPALKEELFRMLGETEYVYDTYVVREEVEFDGASTSESTQSTEVWRDSGIFNSWGDSFTIADQGVDMIGILDSSQALLNKIQDNDSVGAELTFSPEGSEVNESDLDDSDNENYRFNDYPEDEDEMQNFASDDDEYGDYYDDNA